MLLGNANQKVESITSCLQ